jgi:glycosyltransferase involved in cell wall biosynthesis
MQTLPTITIGIAAYNEEHTLSHLLSDLSKQQQDTYQIEQVIVVSDASTDNTAAVAKNHKDLPTTVVTNKNRCGKKCALNYFVTHAKTDILVVFDADVRIKDFDMIAQLIKPIVKESADLVGAAVHELAPSGLIEHALAASMDMKRHMFEAHRSGNNIYTCHGRARAFSRKLYQSIRFESSVNEDAFSYIYCIRHGFSYQYAKRARVWYRLPTTLADHVKQSVRFIHSKSDHDFHNDPVVKAEYSIPTQLIIMANIRTSICKPIIILYYTILLYTSLLARSAAHTKQHWDTSQSSKITTIQ